MNGLALYRPGARVSAYWHARFALGLARYPHCLAKFNGGAMRVRSCLRESISASYLRTPVPVQSTLGFQIRLNPSDFMYVSPSIAALGWWEAGTAELVHSLSASVRTFVDVGANIGFFSLLAWVCGRPDLQIFAFEPEPVSFELLKESVLLNGAACIRLAELALSNSSGPKVLYISSDGNAGGHSLQSTGGGPRLTVDSMRFDDFARTHNLHSVDLLKIDVEGGEPECLDGCGEWITTGRVPFAIVEWWPDRWHQFPELLRKLSTDYLAFPFDPSLPFWSLTQRPLASAAAGCNIFFIHRSQIGTLGHKLVRRPHFYRESGGNPAE